MLCRAEISMRQKTHKTTENPSNLRDSRLFYVQSVLGRGRSQEKPILRSAIRWSTTIELRSNPLAMELDI